MSTKKKFNVPRFNFEGFQKVKPRLWINVGCLFDIPTATFSIGKKGETIYNGGFGPLMGISGVANNYKSTIAHYFCLSLIDHLEQSGLPGTIMTYDTEEHISLQGLNRLTKRFDYISKTPTTDDNRAWQVTSKTFEPGNIWMQKVRENLERKEKDKDYIIEAECFKDPYEDKPYSCHLPTVVEIDSFSETEAESSEEKLSGDLDSKDTNTYAMGQGLFKTKMFSRFPMLSASSNNYFMCTFHFGEKLDMQMNPYAPQPLKKLQFLKGNQNIKGAGTKAEFLLSASWLAHGAELLKNATTKLAEYPKDGNDLGETDLNIVKLQLLRNKNGPSGIIIPVIVSQSEGVLPTLTEFHFCKMKDKFGIGGNDRSYFMELYPDCSLSRTTIRTKIDIDPKLRRAINITAELLQLKIYHGLNLPNDFLCDAKTLYEDIKKLGYDWNELLNTRGYWLFDQYENEIPFLSTMDLLKIRQGTYKPYFIKENKK